MGVSLFEMSDRRRRRQDSQGATVEVCGVEVFMKIGGGTQEDAGPRTSYGRERILS